MITFIYGHFSLVYPVKQYNWLNYVADRLCIDLRSHLLKIQEKWIHIFFSLGNFSELSACALQENCVNSANEHLIIL